MHPRAAAKLADTDVLGLLGALTQQRIGRRDVGSVVWCVAAMDRLTKASGSGEVAAAAVSTALECLQALSDVKAARRGGGSVGTSGGSGSAARGRDGVRGGAAVVGDPAAERGEAAAGRARRCWQTQRQFKPRQARCSGA